MAASDAKFVPVKNAAFRVTFPILDGAGNSVTGAAGLDSEVSIDAGTFADCTNEATEIATASGVYYLDLTSGEMNGDTIAVQVKTSTTGAKTTFLVLYTAARSVNDLAYPTTSGRSIDVATTGEVGVDFSNVNGTLDAAEIGSGAITSAKFAAGAIDATAIAADALTAAKIASDAGTEIADAVWNSTRAGHTTSGSFGEGVASVQGNVTGSAASVTGAVGSVTGNVGGSTASVTGAVTVGTNNDKTGYTLSNTGIDAVLDRSIVEPSGIFAWPASLRTIIGWLGVVNRNRKTQTSTTTSYRNDADSATLATRTVSDDGTTFTAGEAT